MRITPVLFRLPGCDQDMIKLSMRDREGVERQFRVIAGFDLQFIMGVGFSFPETDEDAAAIGVTLAGGPITAIRYVESDLGATISKNDFVLAPNEFLKRRGLPFLFSCSQTKLSSLWKALDPDSGKLTPMSRRS